MGRPSGNPNDPREYEWLAKVDADGLVVAMVELAVGSGWETWTDGEGHRYVYLTDLVPVDPHGLELLPPVTPTPPTKKTPTKTKTRARRG